jgi:hypothetical protein
MDSVKILGLLHVRLLKNTRSAFKELCSWKEGIYKYSTPICSHEKYRVREGAKEGGGHLIILWGRYWAVPAAEETVSARGSIILFPICV